MRLEEDQESPRRRAVTYDDYVERLERVFPTADAVDAIYQRFRPRPSDVIISPFAKCGTTWLQQIVHSLRSGDDSDFFDIYDVMPWIDVSDMLGHDLDAEQRANPRAFKSHRGYDDLPRGCRYLVSVRDPRDAVVSLYRFMEGWFFEPGSIAIEEFVARRALDRNAGPDYWRHLASWLRQRENPRVLLVVFEDMKQDLRGNVARIADFIGLGADEARIDVAAHLSSFEYMAAHKEPFSDPRLRKRSESAAGLPPHSDSAKVRAGTVGGHRHELPDETVAELDQIWMDTIAAEFGFATYEELAADLVASP